MIKRLTPFLVILLIGAVAFIPSTAEAQKVNKKKRPLKLWEEGLDPMSFHLLGKPFRGKKDHVYQDQELRYKFYFITEKNRNAFASIEKPENRNKKLPAFQGYDPYFLAQGQLQKGQPALFRLYEGKPYWFYNQATFRLWDNGRQNYVNRAESAWKNQFNCGEPAGIQPDQFQCQ